jgi:hypothetical protein
VQSPHFHAGQGRVNESLQFEFDDSPRWTLLGFRPFVMWTGFSKPGFWGGLIVWSDDPPIIIRFLGPPIGIQVVI